MKLALEAAEGIGKERGAPRPAITFPSTPTVPRLGLPRAHRCLGGRPGSDVPVAPALGRELSPDLWFLPDALSEAREPRKVGILGAGQSTRL